ncbi:NADPH:quinone reductase [Actinorhabdospora filicis]|uniref:NADPH:quinone reductase n=2 Tax=Actinorhabdospora filicis TaxID=1785913 RepID=A0A9W6SS75_9ACTN|nr:NADPH:quinone reductase [Actinorhabdospora filicis]
MRAVVLRSFGGPEVLEDSEVDRPEPGPGEFLVRVAAAHVHNVDTMIRRGFLAGEDAKGRPHTGLGHDAAGTVAALGEGATGFAVGDAVIGLHSPLDKPLGAYAEYAVFRAHEVARAPESVDAVAASTVVGNGLTALQSLRQLGLAGGDSLLVTGAAGGVGGFAVQLAAARGLKVTALAGPGDEDLVRGLGASAFVARGGELPSDVDGVLDAAVLGVPALAAVRDGGVLVRLLPGETSDERGVRDVQFQAEADAADLAEVAGLVDAGVLTPRVLDVLPLAGAATAHRRYEGGGLRGRLVLRP